MTRKDQGSIRRIAFNRLHARALRKYPADKQSKARVDWLAAKMTCGGVSIGDVVEVRRERRRAIVTGFLDDIEGGLTLDRKVGGFRFWNVQDVRVVRAW